MISALPEKDRQWLHSDPEKARKDLLERPYRSQGEIEGKRRKVDKKTGEVIQEAVPAKPVPKLGSKTPPKYADYKTPPKSKLKDPVTPEIGRENLPAELSDPYLTSDEEARELTPKYTKQVVEAFNKVDVDALHAAAKGGRAKRGWYKDTADALVKLFGRESARFVGVLAALSPRTSVAENLRMAAQLWAEYSQWDKERAAKGLDGQPTYDEVMKWLSRLQHEDNPQKIKGIMSVIHNNIALALSSEDVDKLDIAALSGPKVDRFRRNLLGDLYQVTLDTWMAKLVGMDQKDLSGRSRKRSKDALKGGGPRSLRVINAEYQAFAMANRMVAKRLTAENPDDPPWTPAEVQECSWAFIRALADFGGKARMLGRAHTPLEALDLLTHEKVSDNADFLSLIFTRDDYGENPVLKAFERAGYGKSLASLEREYQRAKKAKAKKARKGRVAGDYSDAERPAAERAARRAGSLVRGSMTHIKNSFRRHGAVLRFAATPEETYAPPATSMPPADMATALPPPPQQPPPPDEHREALLSLTPNTDDLNFEEALARTRSSNQKAFKKIVEHINEQIGLKAHIHNAVGDWSNGAENSLLQSIREPIDPKTTDYLAAWYGLLANQKAVLAFNPHHGGLDSVYEVEVPSTDLKSVRKSLDAAGIQFRTLVPTKKGTKVVLFDAKRENREQVAQWAGEHSATVRESIGTGRFIGDKPTRTAARAAYRKIITAYEAEAGKAGGKVRTYEPPVQPNHLRPREKGDPFRNSKTGRVIRMSRLKPLKLARDDDLSYHPRHADGSPKETGRFSTEAAKILHHFKEFLHTAKEDVAETVKKVRRKPKVEEKLQYAAGDDPVEHVVSAVKEHGGKYGLAPIYKVRQYLSSKGITDRDAQDKAMHAARKQQHVVPSRLEGRVKVSDEEREGAWHSYGETLGHLEIHPESSHAKAKFARRQAPAGGAIVQGQYFEQAPPGGAVVRGLYYRGGEKLPRKDIPVRRPDGSVPHEAKKYARNPGYTPGVDPRVEKLREATGRGGKGQPPANVREQTPKPFKGISRVGSGLTSLSRR